jgi:F420-dependent oxidoreductase-like protein
MMSRAISPVTRLGLQIPYFTFPGVPGDRLFERVAAIARTAEESGFDSVWVMDHFYQIGVQGPRTEPMLEAYTLLGGIAARTHRVRLGAMVTGVTYRNPALLAKIVTTLDVVSGGRAVLGIGAAWNEDEHRGYGYEFPPLRERFERLEDAIQICRAMFTSAEAEHAGRHHRIQSALNIPRPLTPGGPPILIGGSGERRTIPLVARYADACNFFGDLDTVRHKLEVLEHSCAQIGRDPAEITKTRLGSLIVGETAEAARRTAREVQAARGIPDDRMRSSYLIGDADTVAERASEFLGAGLDGLLFNLPDAGDLRPVERAGHALAAVGGAAAA